ncbi:MAG: hypothetical protein LBS96_06570 [Oscillospiraceae bacterium]|jgi:hypothetical protein|nr:hypothetical protein [Oscillospiraceae bacterium]
MANIVKEGRTQSGERKWIEQRSDDYYYVMVGYGKQIGSHGWLHKWDAEAIYAQQ